MQLPALPINSQIHAQVTTLPLDNNLYQYRRLNMQHNQQILTMVVVRTIISYLHS